MTTRSRIAFTLLLTATLGCSSRDDPKPVELDTSTAAGGVTVTLDAMFGKIAGCMKAGAPYVDFMGRTTDGLAQQYQASVDAGAIVYDQGQVSACLAAVQAASCAELTPGGDVNGTKLAACGPVLVPQVADGDPCTWNAECTSGWCHDEGTCPFHCAARQIDGSACAGDEECLSDACNTTSDLCVANVPGKVGEACGDGDVKCEAGLYCRFQSTAPIGWYCTAQVGEGVACATDPQCLSGLGCADDGYCRPLAAVGLSCSAAACGHGAFCSAAAGTRCADDPWRSGDSCAEYTSCWNGLHCSSGDVCIAGTAAEGDTCDAAADLFCVDGTWCSAGTCTAYTSSGTVCP